MRFLYDTPKDMALIPFNGTILITKGDFCYLEVDDVRPFSSQADQLTLILNQARGARLFLGIANDTRFLADTQAVAAFPVVTDAEVEYPCSSATFEIGDLVAPVEDSGGTYLENQKVVKTTDPSLAIGKVTKRYGSATTTVQFRCMSRVLPTGQVKGDEFCVAISQTLHASKTAWNLFTAQEALQVVGIDYVPDIAQGGAATATVVKCEGTAAPVAATTPMISAAFDANATANTNQQGALTATAADLLLAPGDRIGVKFSTAPTVGSGLFSIRLRRL